MLYIIFTISLFFSYGNKTNISCFKNNQIILSKDFSTDIDENNLEPKTIYESTALKIDYEPFGNKKDFNYWALLLKDENSSYKYTNNEKDTFNFNSLTCEISENNNRNMFLYNTVNYTLKLLNNNFINYKKQKKPYPVIANNEIKYEIIDNNYCEFFINPLDENKENLEKFINDNFIGFNIYNFVVSSSKFFFNKDTNTFVTSLYLNTSNLFYEEISAELSCFSNKKPTTIEEFKKHFLDFAVLNN